MEYHCGDQGSKVESFPIIPAEQATVKVNPAEGEWENRSGTGDYLSIFILNNYSSGESYLFYDAFLRSVCIQNIPLPKPQGTVGEVCDESQELLAVPVPAFKNI